MLIIFKVKNVVLAALKFRGIVTQRSLFATPIVFEFIEKIGGDPAGKFWSLNSNSKLGSSAHGVPSGRLHNPARSILKLYSVPATILISGI